MMNRNRLLNKYLLLAVIFIAMLAMSGCRTRITNNNEVSNVYYDEDGFLTETYQMRRDELGLSTAEKPILPDLGSGDTEDDFDSAEDSNFNYEPEEDNYVEPSNTGNPSTTPSRTRTSRTGTTGGSGSGTTDNKWIIVTLDPNGGSADKTAIKVKKGETYGKRSKLPTLPEWKDKNGKNYSFSSWNTKKDGSGKTVTNSTSVSKSSNHTLYAQWNPSSPKDNNVEVTFIDDNGKKVSVKVKKGEDYTIPKDKEPSERKGFKFIGWEDDSGKKYVTGDKISKVSGPINLKAKWELQPEDYWYDVAKPVFEDDSKKKFSAVQDNIDTKYLEDCNGELSSNENFYVVIVDSEADIESKKEELNKMEELDKAKVLIITKPPTDEKKLLLYRMNLYKELNEKDKLKSKISEVEKYVKDYTFKYYRFEVEYKGGSGGGDDPPSGGDDNPPGGDDPNPGDGDDNPPSEGGE